MTHLRLLKPTNRLNDLLVLSIRELYSEGCPVKELAAEYKVSVQTIRAIVHRRTWDHLPPEMTPADALEGSRT